MSGPEYLAAPGRRRLPSLPWRQALPAGLAIAAVFAVGHLEVFEWPVHMVPCCGSMCMFTLGLAAAGHASLTARPRRAFWSTMVAMACVVGIGAGVLVQRSIAAANRGAGDRIAAALERYRAEHARYPDALHALVPQWLDALPAARLGLFRELPFEYDPRGYELSFATTEFDVWQRGPDGRWVHRD